MPFPPTTAPTRTQSATAPSFVFNQAQFDAGRYTDDSVVFADPNGFGYIDTFRYDTSIDRADANLATIWDASVSAADQGTGTGTGAFVRNAGSLFIRDFGYITQNRWTSAFNRAIKFMSETGTKVTVGAMVAWYDVDDLDFYPNATENQMWLDGEGMKNSVISHIGTGNLFTLGDPAKVTMNAQQDWNGAKFTNLGMTTKTGKNCIDIGWRYSGTEIRECQIEGFSGHGIGNLDPAISVVSNKAWSTEVYSCNIVYCGVGIRNANHALNVDKQTRIYFCDIGFEYLGGAACKYKNSDISACAVAQIAMTGGFSGSGDLEIEDNYFEYGYNLIFGPDDGTEAPQRPLSIDGTHSKLVTPSAVFMLVRDMSITSLSVTGNLIAGKESQTAFDFDMNSAGTQRFISNLNIQNNRVSKDADGNGGEILTVQNFAGETFENLTYKDNGTSGGRYTTITNLDRSAFNELQVSFNRTGLADTVDSATNAELDDPTSDINVHGKTTGKPVWQDAGTPRPLWAAGPNPLDPWVSHTGAVIRQPA